MNVNDHCRLLIILDARAKLLRFTKTFNKLTKTVCKQFYFGQYLLEYVYAPLLKIRKRVSLSNACNQILRHQMIYGDVEYKSAVRNENRHINITKESNKFDVDKHPEDIENEENCKLEIILNDGKIESILKEHLNKLMFENQRLQLDQKELRVNEESSGSSFSRLHGLINEHSGDFGDGNKALSGQCRSEMQSGFGAHTNNGFHENSGFSNILSDQPVTRKSSFQDIGSIEGHILSNPMIYYPESLSVTQYPAIEGGSSIPEQKGIFQQSHPGLYSTVRTGAGAISRAIPHPYVGTGIIYPVNSALAQVGNLPCFGLPKNPPQYYASPFINHSPLIAKAATIDNNRDGNPDICICGSQGQDSKSVSTRCMSYDTDKGSSVRLHCDSTVGHEATQADINHIGSDENTRERLNDISIPHAHYHRF
ncbi:hypothetical protein GJ496_004949 [Pomphorhynchus laevis]|nr:hypothetical protein GJ496_004949 [Pomphorhynchus laevis]